MSSPSSLRKRARAARTFTDELFDSIESALPPDEGRTEALTDEEVADLWAFHLAIADGLTEEDIRKREPDLYRRLQARYLTQAEITRDRLNQLPYR